MLPARIENSILWTRKQYFVDIAWSHRDKKTPLLNLEEKLMMKMKKQQALSWKQDSVFCQTVDFEL